MVKPILEKAIFARSDELLSSEEKFEVKVREGGAWSEGLDDILIPILRLHWQEVNQEMDLKTSTVDQFEVIAEINSQVRLKQEVQSLVPLEIMISCKSTWYRSSQLRTY